MLQQYLPLLAMTFFISLFIVLMQFLWGHIGDLVGKGLGIGVIGELFFYAALSMVPLSLPLAVLLASLMTFGNLGEKFELTALKAAGISLFQIMRPLIVFMCALSIGAFYFQNYALPVAQTKMWTLLFSVRQKSPEVEIPERAFYDQIPGMNLYVDHKDKESGMLYDVIIYDMTKGMDNSRVILADSAKLNFTESKTHLFLHLYQGEMFENLRGTEYGLSTSNYLPFRRESFDDKQIYFPFDVNFNRMDESTMRNQYVGKNIAELTASIDSIGGIVDSIGDAYGQEIKTRPYVDVQYYQYVNTDSGVRRQPMALVAVANPIDLDSVFAGSSPGAEANYAKFALIKAERQKQDFEYRSAILLEQAKLMRRHDIERQKKFTLSFACLIFFFIGAPLGAIIKKGGLGTPLVISVILFIVYYIIDNLGYKMARDGKLEVWMGIWLSSAVLLPLGIFFTYKAKGDSAVFNLDAYKLFFWRMLGRKMKRTLTPKEVIMHEVEPERAQVLLADFMANARKMQQLGKRPILQRIMHRVDYGRIDEQLAAMVEYLANSRSRKAISLLNQYPFRLNRRALPGVISTTEALAAELGLDLNSQTDDNGTEDTSRLD